MSSFGSLHLPVTCTTNVPGGRWIYFRFCAGVFDERHRQRSTLLRTLNYCIIDDSWEFTTKQCRKRVLVELVQTSQEKKFKRQNDLEFIHSTAEPAEVTSPGMRR